MSCHSPHRGALVLLLLLYGAAVHAVDTSNILIVDLYLNSQYMGETFVLQDEAENYFVEETVLLEWQISRPWPQPKQFRGSNYYGVHQFEGATAEINSRAMELYVSVPPALMPSRSVEMGRSDMVARSEGFGTYMDYDLNWLKQELEASQKEADTAKQQLEESQEELQELISKIEQANDTLAGRDEIVIRTRKALDIAVQLLGEIDLDDDEDDDLDEEEED